MNNPLVEMLSCVTDARRKQAKRYSLANNWLRVSPSCQICLKSATKLDL